MIIINPKEKTWSDFKIACDFGPPDFRKWRLFSSECPIPIYDGHTTGDTGETTAKIMPERKVAKLLKVASPFCIDYPIPINSGYPSKIDICLFFFPGKCRSCAHSWHGAIRTLVAPKLGPSWPRTWIAHVFAASPGFDASGQLGQPAKLQESPLKKCKGEIAKSKLTHCRCEKYIVSLYVFVVQTKMGRIQSAVSFSALDQHGFPGLVQECGALCCGCLQGHLEIDFESQGFMDRGLSEAEIWNLKISEDPQRSFSIFFRCFVHVCACNIM